MGFTDMLTVAITAIHLPLGLVLARNCRRNGVQFTFLIISAIALSPWIIAGMAYWIDIQFVEQAAAKALSIGLETQIRTSGYQKATDVFMFCTVGSILYLPSVFGTFFYYFYSLHRRPAVVHKLFTFGRAK